MLRLANTSLNTEAVVHMYSIKSYSENFGKSTEANLWWNAILIRLQTVVPQFD